MSLGRWRLLGATELFAPLQAELEAAARAGRNERGPRTLAGHAVYLKASRLARGPALRHALRRALGRGEIPRLQELANLTWLRAHGFLAPEPLLAGVLERRGLPRYQFLCTALLAARDLAERLPSEAPEQRALWLDPLAHDLARMHALGFVHGDLFPRNLLACASADGPRVGFLDAWSTVPGRARRGPAHDLACLFVEGFFTREETARLTDVYLGERARLGSPAPGTFAAALERALAAVRRREGRRHPDILTRGEARAPEG